MKILILNWRDVRNPSSGGAEILTQEIASRFVKMGHRVTQFSSTFPHSLKEENINGVKIIRAGHPDARYLFSSVHFLAFWYYKKYWKNKFDLIIDEVHGIPFFTPWYVKEKKIVLICEVADSLWKQIFGFFFGSLGWAAEKFYLRFVYRKIHFLTISASTQKDLLNNFVDNKRITVLPMGITVPKKIKRVDKEKNPTLLFVGRLTKAKGVEDAILALRELAKAFPRITLWIVGRGEEDYVFYLEEFMQQQKMEKRVRLLGFLSEEKKFEVMGRAHILLQPSEKEGFGLTIPEAGFMGTPVVAYDTAGIRDVVKDGINGMLVKRNSIKFLSSAVKNLLTDKKLYEKLVSGAKKEAGQYNWNKTAKVAMEVIREI